MEKAKAPSVKTSKNRRVLEIIILLSLTSIAIFLWSAPVRREKALKSGSLSFLSAEVTKNPQDQRALYWLAVKRQQLGDIAGALRAFREAAAKDSDDEDAWQGWAATAGALGATQEAFSVLDKFVQQHKQSEKARLSLAIFYDEQDSRLRAYEEATKVTQINPKNLVAWRLVGTEGLHLQHYPEALNAFNQAIAIDPSNWRNYLGLGNALKHNKKYIEAEQTFEKATKMAPQEIVPLRALGSMQLEQAKDMLGYQKAEISLKKALVLDPNDPSTLFYLGQTQMRQGNLADAQVSWEKSARIAPNSAKTFYELSSLYRKIGKNDLAKIAQNRHSKIYAYDTEVYNLQSQLYQVKDNTQIRLKLARLLASHGEINTAAREYRRLIVRAPKLIEAQRELQVLEKQYPKDTAETVILPVEHGNETASIASLSQDTELLLEQGNFLEAQKNYIRIISQEPKNADAYAGLGLALLSMNKQQEAFQLLQKALSIDAKQTKGHYGLGRLFYQMGFPEEAIKHLEQSIATDSENHAALYWLGLCQRDMNSSDIAEEKLKQAVILQPKNGLYRAQLARSQASRNQLLSAEMLLRQALKDSPDDASVQAICGTFFSDRFEQTKDKKIGQEAESLLQASLKKMPNYSTLYYLGGLYITLNQPQKAVELLEQSIESNPMGTKTWYRLAKSYESLKNKQRADYCRQRFKELSDLELEIAALEGQVRLRLKDASIRLKLARLYIKRLEFSKGLNQYEMCIYLDPNNTIAKNEIKTLKDSLKKNGLDVNVQTFNAMLNSMQVKKG
jgi:tetratricopeptide (TPR) repeat protein